MSPRYAHPVFGPGRRAAAKAAHSELRNASEALEAAGGAAWAPEVLRLRKSEAQTARELYSEYGDSLLESPSFC